MKKKVIVVDDSRTARQQVRSVLSEAGYDIVEAIDGRDGIAKIGDNSDASLVLCDVNMPHLGGLDMLATLKETSPAQKMLFIMLTTEAEPQLVQRAKSVGAKGWIVKPFKPELLVAAVRKLVGDA
jgi:two-component system chemotaxis response regulator CheY